MISQMFGLKRRLLDLSIIDSTTFDLSIIMDGMYDSTPQYLIAPELGFRVVRLAQAVRAAHGAHLAELGVGLTEAWALATVRDGRASRPGDLAQALGVDPAAVTRMIKKMAGKGWVRRSRRGDDLRSVHLELTPKASDLLLKIDAALERAEQDLRRGMSPQDASALARLLDGRLNRP